MAVPKRFHLEVVRGAGAGSVVSGDRSRPFTIGRSSECTFHSAEPTMSRRHAVIEPTANGFRIRDVGSLAGTKLFGQKVPADGHLIEDGDEFEMGATVVRVRLVTGEETRPGPSRPPTIPPLPRVPSRPPESPPPPAQADAPTSFIDLSQPLRRAEPARPKPIPDTPGRPRIIRDRMGSYGIVSMIEKGDGERVDVAFDERTGAEVALHRIERARLGWLARRRVAKDCEQRRDAQHPNLAVPVDWGRAGEWLFTATPHSEGEYLHELLRFARGRKPLPIPLVAYLGRAVASGLAGLDPACEIEVSPRRILLSRSGRVVLQDIGPTLALLKGQPDRYTAPEQDAGRGAGLRSAIFALGVSLYEAFTGEPVETERKSTLRSVDTIRIDLPGPLADVVMRAVEVRPQDRQADPSELASDLERELEKIAPDFDDLAAADWLVEHYPARVV